jgi:hypothetical protein
MKRSARDNLLQTADEYRSAPEHTMCRNTYTRAVTIPSAPSAGTMHGCSRTVELAGVTFDDHKVKSTLKSPHAQFS